MRIAVFGAGNIGGTLAKRLEALGHDVAVASSKGPEGIARGADLVVVAVPLKAVPDLPAGEITSTVVDANNYYPGRDGRIDAIEAGTPSSRWVADQLGGATVVKAFNTMNWRNLLDDGRPAGDPGRLAMPLAGDDEAAKATVAELIDALGFDPVDAGTLDDSRRQEPGTPVYGANLGAEGARDALA